MSDLQADSADRSSQTISLVVFAITVIPATLLGVLVRGPNVLALDLRLLNRIQEVNFTGLESLVALSNVVFGTLPALTIMVSLVALGVTRRDRMLIAQIVILVGLRLAGELLKPAFESPRPGPDYQRDPAYIWNTLGYPSGHAFTATLVAGVLVITVMRTGLGRGVRWAIYLLACLIVVVAAFPRIWIGAHWPTDTVGGILYGTSAVALTIFATSFIPSSSVAPPNGRS